MGSINDIKNIPLEDIDLNDIDATAAFIEGGDTVGPKYNNTCNDDLVMYLSDKNVTTDRAKAGRNATVVPQDQFKIHY